MDRSEAFVKSAKMSTNDRISLTSSKGNQEKWCNDDGFWYKLDQFGYEALSEAVTSDLLKQSNILQDTPFTFVNYKVAECCVHNAKRTASVSKNFLHEGEHIITISKLLSGFSNTPFTFVNYKVAECCVHNAKRTASVSKNFLHEGEHIITISKLLSGFSKNQLLSTLNRISSDKKRLQYIVEQTEEITGLKEFHTYISLLFEIDSYIVNDDRHLNNIAVIEKDGKFGYCPIFDNGAGLLSNMQIYRSDIEPKGLIKSVLASPFRISFNREVNMTHSLYGPVLQMPNYTKSQILDLVLPYCEYYPQKDRPIIAERVVSCILERQKFHKF